MEHILAPPKSLAHWIDCRFPAEFIYPFSQLYAVGDIHGRLDELVALMKKVEREICLDPETLYPVLVFLGDYVDRGPWAKEVVSYLLHDLPEVGETHFLRGNHDECINRILSTDSSRILDWAWRLWTQPSTGGAATLASYGVHLKKHEPPFHKLPYARIKNLRQELREKMPLTHQQFFWRTEPYVVCGGCLFVHAGVSPTTPYYNQHGGTLYNIRDAFLEHRGGFHGKTVIFGHTASRDGLPYVDIDKIGVDAGCSFDDGRLACMVRKPRQQPRFLFSRPMRRNLWDRLKMIARREPDDESPAWYQYRIDRMPPLFDELHR